MSASVDELADLAFATFLRHQPEHATVLGLHELGLDDQVTDWSEEGAQRQRRDLDGLLSRLAAIDRSSLELQGRITYDLVERECRERLALIDAALEEFAVAPFAVGAQAHVLTFLPKIELHDAVVADAYLERVGRLPAMLDQAAERLSAGVSKGRIPPVRAVEGGIGQIDGYLAADPDDDPLLLAPPDGVAAPDDWRDRLRVLLADRVRPAMTRFRAHLADVVAPAARPDDRSGLTYLPGGDALYALMVRQHTTTERSPEEIHQLGRDLIGHLREEYATLGGRVFGTSDQAVIFDRLRNDPELRYRTPHQVRTDAEAAIARAADAAPAWFGRLPTVRCEVRPMSAFEEETAPPAYYMPPPMDGSRPGVYWVNTGQPETRERYLSEAIAFHEAIPGHHLQIALAQTLDHLPRLRQVSTSTAYVEGWGLYAERLADEIGLYSSDLKRVGVLATDSWRACRLVVDTGLHHLGWSRDQAVAFMREHSPVAPSVIDVEVDRYIGMPGQALSYMVGRVELDRLRGRSEQRLGDRFDVRRFHDTVLLSGSLPLTILEEVVEAWLSSSSTT